MTSEGRGAPGGPSPEREKRVREVADAYREALRGGERPDREAILAAHPEIADALRDRLAQVEMMYEAGHAGLEPPAPRGGETASLSEQPPSSAPIDTSDLDETPERIGTYKILGLLGEGGMGMVYLAEQTEPVKRRVALKLIKLGMDTKEVVARFESERQALAMMDHAGIAKVFDAGATESGRPFFVMELVKGIPITEYCDQARLPMKERLLLFDQVCQALQHAHQKGVIHRDLKPSNILVSLADDKPTPKVIDFGIAKATSQRLTERTLFTEQGQIVGTPEYMSPEQAEATALDVDTRTDIYSLGAVLYELLTGTLPFDPEELRSKGYAEIRRIIREEEPEKPSTRLSALGEDSERIAVARKTDTTTLSRALRGDLDWIVMKALEKDRSRRYATASELAADIRRHLEFEPVLAGPPSAAYRLRKLIRKNRTAVVAASCIAFALIAATVFSTAMYLREQDALGSEEEARALAEERRLRAETVSEFLTGMFRSVDPELDGREILVVDLLDRAAGDIESGLAGHSETEAALRGAIGDGYLGLGIYDRAERELGKALQLLETAGGDPDNTLSTREAISLLRFRQGRIEEAEKLNLEILEECRGRLGDRDPHTLAALGLRARILAKKGEIEGAVALFRDLLGTYQELFGPQHKETLSTMSGLAAALQGAGEWEEAEMLFGKALDGQIALLGEEHPGTLTTMNDLALLYHAQGKLDEAKSLYERAIEIGSRRAGKEHPGTLTALNNLARVHQAQGDLEKAESAYRSILRILAEELEAGNLDALITLDNLASVIEAQGRLAEAETLYRKAVDGFRASGGPRHPDTLIAINNLALCLKRQGRFDDAEVLYREALEGRREVLGPGHPDTIQSMSNLARLLQAKGDLADAEGLMRKVLAGYRDAIGVGHPQTLHTMINLSQILRLRGDLEGAEELLRQGVGIGREELGEGHIQTLTLMHNLAGLLGSRGDLEDAERMEERVIRTARESLPEGDWRIGVYLSEHGRLLLDQGKYDAAEASLLQAHRTLVQRFGPDADRSQPTVRHLVALYEAWDKPEKAEEYRLLLRTSESPATEEGPRDPGSGGE